MSSLLLHRQAHGKATVPLASQPAVKKKYIIIKMIKVNHSLQLVSNRCKFLHATQIYHHLDLVTLLTVVSTDNNMITRVKVNIHSKWGSCTNIHTAIRNERRSAKIQ